MMKSTFTRLLFSKSTVLGIFPFSYLLECNRPKLPKRLERMAQQSSLLSSIYYFQSRHFSVFSISIFFMLPLELIALELDSPQDWKYDQAKKSTITCLLAFSVFLLSVIFWPSLISNPLEPHFQQDRKDWL